jgi:hypothetical protein
MDLKYLIKNKDLIFLSKNKIKELNTKIDDTTNSFLSGFKNSFFVLSFLFTSNLIIGKAIDFINPSSEYMTHLIGFLSAGTCFVTFLCVSYFLINKINKIRIKNKKIYKILKLHDQNVTSLLSKKTIKKIKAIFKDSTSEEIDFLSDSENNKYFNINSNVMKNIVFDYIRENKVSKEEKEIINDIVKEYKINLDQEKLDLLLFKNNQDYQNKYIVKNNIVIKNI